MENKYINKVFEKIKGALNYHPVNGISIDFSNLNDFIDKRSGMNTQLKKVGDTFKEKVMNIYGTTKEESNILWDKSRAYLKKLSYIETLPEILYNDWIRYQKNPYYINNGDYDDPKGKYNLKKLDDFINFIDYVGLGWSTHDPHNNESIYMLDELDESDFDYMRNELFDMIENETDTFFINRWDNETNDENDIITENIDEVRENPSFKDDLINKKIYEKVFKIFDKNPKNTFKILKNLHLNTENYDSFILECNLVYKYLTEHENRTPYYINVEFDSDDISDFFYDDRGYDIREMVKNFLDDDFDYGHDYECMDVDSWLIDKINKSNMDLLKEKYLNNLDGESSDDDFMEFIESEYGTDIGCAAGDAQYSADIEALHNDFMNGINDYLSNFNGKWDWNSHSFVGEVEIGELVFSEHFDDVLYDSLESNYPSGFEEIFADIKELELSGWGGQYNYFFPEDLIKINGDRHFRYGGAGNIDWNYFNEILSDRLYE